MDASRDSGHPITQATPTLVTCPPLDHHYHRRCQHHQVVWTVPICTSSVKSDIYSNPEDYSYVRGPSYDNFQRRESQSWERQEHEFRGLDLDESGPGPHV